MGRLGLRTTACVLVTMATLASCASDRASAPTIERAPQLDPHDLPIVGFFVGEYDGHELTFRDATRDELIEAGVALPGQDGETGEVGVTSAPLVDIPSMACGSACTGSSYVGFTNVAGSRRSRDGGTGGPIGSDTLWTNADLATCGSPPTGSLSGVCVAVRMRNMYTTQLERVYVELVDLDPTGMTTSVNTPSMPFTARSDFGISPDFTNAMWRYGEVARATSVAGSPSVHWAFHGSTPPGSTFTFTFLAQVRGLVVQPTRRATLAAGQTDNPGAGAYSAQTHGPSNSSTGVAISENGRYVVFGTSSSSITGTTGNFIVRKDLQTGAVDLVNSVSCSSAPQNPHISADGSVVVFSAGGCDLTGLGSNPPAPVVYVRDFAAGTTELATFDTGGGYPNGTSSQPRVSADGQVVVFQSTANDIVAGQPTRTCNEVYRFDRSTQTISHVSGVLGGDIFDTSMGWTTSCSLTVPAGESPDVSGDGNIIVFHSSQPLDPADTANRDVYVYDHVATQATGVYIVYRVSLTSSGTSLSGGTSTTGISQAIPPAVSVDGTMLVFSTDANNVFGTGTSTSLRRHIYRRQVAEGADASIERVTLRVNDGEASASSAGIPAISSTGRFVAFWSAANDLASAGTFAPSGTQVYVCDMAAPVASLTRCWVASTLQPDAAAGSAFNVLSGGAGSGTRIGLAYSSDIDPGYVVYQASSSSGWGAVSTGTVQTWVSPVGDPRYQQASNGP